jgi:hypothetical protein
MKEVHEYVGKARHKLRLDRLPPLWRKVIVAAVGGLFFIAGVIMLVTPGPAFVFIPLGLLLLASEFTWAERIADKMLRGISELQRRWHQRKERRTASG